MSRTPAALDQAPVAPVVAIAIEVRDWSTALPGVRALCQRAVVAAMQGAQVGAHGQAHAGAMGRALGRALGHLEISILLTEDRTVRALNRDHRGQDRATNVLSFAGTDAISLQIDAPPGDSIAGPAPILLGDVVVAFETVAAEAASQGKTLADHLSHLIVHGILHLLGYHHEVDNAARRMERLETGILADLGVADPYSAGPCGADPCDDVIGDERPLRIK